MTPHFGRQWPPGYSATSALDDSARFRPEDPEDLVAASFACPLCLCAAAQVLIVRHDTDATASCLCRHCALGWRVGLDPSQTLRMLLAPPADVSVRLALPG
jgi:hypothetical protein